MFKYIVLGLTSNRIPFERALDFANKEKITELLYPLFVHNIGALLYHPTNQTRTNAVMAAAERRKQDQNQMRNNPQPPGLPSLHQHHHHSMSNALGGPLPQPQHSLAPHPGAPRPSLDRAHTFPTPPTSASSVMGNMGNSDGSFQWGAQGINVQGTNPLSIDTGLSNARSMPTTPATTPPGTSLQSMPQYQNPQPYDSSRQMYSAPPPQQNTYSQSAPSQQSMSQYPPPSSYIKHEMGPPLTRASGTESDHHESKDSNGLIHHQGNGQSGHGQGEEEAEHEHDGEYTHDNSTNYESNRRSYAYNNGPAPGPLSGEHSHISPEMTGSPSHPASGRATPRTASAPQSYYSQQPQSGYNTPPRLQALQPSSSNLYNVISNERGSTNGSTSGDVYAPQAELGNSISNGYPAPQNGMNGTPGSNKRGRDDDDDARPSSRGPAGAEGEGLKRRKTIREGSVSGPSYETPLNRARSTIARAGRR